MKELDSLVQAGLLKREPGDQNEFDGLVAGAKAALADTALSGLSENGRFDRAYKAAHAFSLAALRRHGFRPNRKRYIVFQVLPHTLRAPAELARILDKCHGLRNFAEYEGHFEIDEKLMKELAGAVHWLQGAVDKLGRLS